MKLGQPQDVILNYNSLYKLNPETARAAILGVYKQINDLRDGPERVCYNSPEIT